MQAEDTKRHYPHTAARGGGPPGGTQQAGPVRLWADPLEQWICLVNIDSYRDQLAHTTDTALRAALSRRLLEQEARLSRFSTPVSPRAKAEHA